MNLNSLTIPQGLLPVKFSTGKKMLLAVLFLLPACAAEKKLETTAEHQPAHYKIHSLEVKQSHFEPHPNYLSMSLTYAPVAELLRSLEANLAVSLKNRGEAHVTVLTPPEFDILKTKLTMDEINEIANQNAIQSSDLNFLCVGEAVNRQEMKTYFLVVRSENLLKIRQAIQNLYRSRGGLKKFEATHFYPHVTMGFTERDLHEEGDGVVKNENSCIAPVSTL
jgi:2'-5' RNA ligase